MIEPRTQTAVRPTPRKIQSMTGSASEHLNITALSLQIEFKSVNSRFLDLSFKLADEVRQLEPLLRERLLSTFLRGKIECKIGLRLAPSINAQASVLSIDVVQSLRALEREILSHLPSATPLSVAEVLRWPGVLPEATLPSDIETACLTLADEAIVKLSAARETEGRHLSAFIMERLDQIRLLTDTIKQRSPELMATHEQRLLERLNATLGKAEALNLHIPQEETLARIRQEITLYGIKIDVAEEISRLESHLKECHAILSKPGPCGKRLDFMVQELNREANTLASKSVAIGLSQTAVDLKVLIEQIREQIQNLE
jgi:uncharacterized protein (TIGR00255 family)